MAMAALMAAQQKQGGAPDMKKYERMKKMGLPMNSILNRMRMDGVSDSEIEAFGGGAAAKKTVVEEVQIMPAQVQQRMKQMESEQKRMKPFHWAKINSHQANDKTLWKDASKQLPALCQNIDFARLEDLFSRETEAASQKKNGANKRKQNNKLIDPKRDQNVMIGLRNMGMSQDDLLDAILQMDDKKLSTEKLRKLLPYVPSDGELQMVRDYVKNGGNVNELGAAEQFFVKMMDMVGIRERVKLWIFKSEFPSILQSVQSRIALVAESIRELKTNARLQKVLLTVLAVGNYMNAGSSRGNAFGFCMEPTLDLLDGTKSRDKTSLMLFVVEALDADARQWVDDLEVLERVAKIKTNDILNNLDAIKRDMEAIQKYLKSRRQTMTKMASDWAREGAAVSVSQVASHIRKLSKSGPKALFNGCETYAGLKVGMGLPGSYKPNFAKKAPAAAAVEDAKEDDLEENVFGKVMLIFSKGQNSKVTEVETMLKRTQIECKELATYFGFEDGKKWEEVLGVFYQFRERFMKAARELEMKRQKEERKQKQNETKQALQEGLLKRKDRKDIPQLNKVVNPDDDEAAVATSSKAPTGASAMYAAFKKSKKSNAAHKKVLNL